MTPIKDISGQNKTIQVGTHGSAAGAYGVKTIATDDAALRKAVPPNSENGRLTHRSQSGLANDIQRAKYRKGKC